MNFEASQFSKSVLKLSVGLAVTANFSIVAFPAVAQQDKELQEVCKNMALEIVYASKPPLNLKVQKDGYFGPRPMFPSSYSNVNSVVSYSAEFAEMSDDPHAPRVNLPSGQKIINYSATGDVGLIRLANLSLFGLPLQISGGIPKIFKTMGKCKILVG